jgi:peptidoglycan/xylan/chitin deacetylase (PgdA/CDA1 family)
VSPTVRVALTFDAEHHDRPAPVGGTERVLDLLADRAVAATFFLQGRWVEAYPDLARRVADDGHTVANHSHYHVRAPLLTPEGFATDIGDAEAVIRDATGVDPRPWYRLPFGAGADDAAIHGRLGGLGYRHVHWDCEVWDWRPGLTARQVEDSFVDAVAAVGDGCVALLHPWPGPVAGALPGILDRLTAQGASFVTVDALDRIPDGRLDEAPV